MKVHKTRFPYSSILDTTESQYDYSDSYKGYFKDIDSKIVAQDAGKAFFASAPSWVRQLLKFRNNIVKNLGLKTSPVPSDSEEYLSKFECKEGEQLGLFQVIHASETEVVFGENDKHLDFKVSLLLEQSEYLAGTRSLTITTTVNFNNWFGRIYFIPVGPMHKLVVPAILKGILKQLEEKALVVL